MKQRILPPEDWHRLEGTEAGTVWQTFDPKHTRVLVVEEGGKIVGEWTAQHTVTMECLWVDPEYRGSFGVAKRLLKGMREIAKGWGVKVVYTGSMSEHVTDLIERFGGAPSPAQTFILPVEMNSMKRRAEQDLGRDFHRQLAVLVPEDVHPDDDEHDLHVGRALHTAVYLGDPERAEAEYNEWAVGAGYVPVRFICQGDGKVRADINTAVIEVDRDYRVSLVMQEESCRQPQ